MRCPQSLASKFAFLNTSLHPSFTNIIHANIYIYSLIIKIIMIILMIRGVSRKLTNDKLFLKKNIYDEK